MALIQLECAGRKVLVTNLEFKPTGILGCQLVNNGRDDLYDIGFRDEELENNSLKILAVEDKPKQGRTLEFTFKCPQAITDCPDLHEVKDEAEWQSIQEKLQKWLNHLEYVSIIYDIDNDTMKVRKFRCACN